jgi:DNA integrity scanning protein DisA with diadenylate cyclase activity
MKTLDYGWKQKMIVSDEVYLELEGVISDLELVHNDEVAAATLKCVAEQVYSIEKNFNALVEALGYQPDMFSTNEDMEKLVKVAKYLQKVKTALLTSEPEKTGALFITGVSGERDDMGLPEYISVCPTQGLDGFAMYKKHTEYSAPGY